MKIAITLPLAGKTFCLEEHKLTIESIIYNNPEIEFKIYSTINTTKKKYIKNVKKWLNRLDAVYEVIESEPIGNTTAENQDKRKRVQEVYEKLFGMVEDCDYVLNIEDDVVCRDPEALRKLLKCFENEDVITAHANVYSRVGDGKPQARMIRNGIKRPYNDKLRGYSMVDSCALSFWLTRFDKLKELWIQPTYRGVGGTDMAWGYRIKIENLGKIAFYWEVFCRHYKKKGLYNSPEKNRYIDVPLADNVVHKTYRIKKKEIINKIYKI
jgi:hypothetical protein